MGIHNICHWVIADVPHMLDNRRPRQHPVLVSQQKLKESILFIRQRDFLPRPPHAMRSRIELQVCRFESDHLLWASTPQQGPDSSQQLDKGEGLRQKLIGAGIETGDLGLQGIARGQQQYRSRVSRRPNSSAEREAIELGQHDVEYQKIVWVY